MRKRKPFKPKQKKLLIFLSISHLKNESAGNLIGWPEKIIGVSKNNDG